MSIWPPHVVHSALQLYRVTGQCGNQHMSRWSCQGAVIWNNHHNVILFCHSSLWPTEGLNVTRVEKNDIPIIIMTNYDQLEFFNLWIWGPTADRLICFSLLLIWQAIKNNWEKIMLAFSWKSTEQWQWHETSRIGLLFSSACLPHFAQK